MDETLKQKLKVYKELPKWKGKIFMKDEETCYLDGYAQGAKENGIQWHDLRKDPNDLPKDNVVLIQTESNCHFIALYYPEEKWWGTYEMLSHRIHGKIIAWCEIPQFKE